MPLARWWGFFISENIFKYHQGRVMHRTQTHEDKGADGAERNETDLVIRLLGSVARHRRITVVEKRERIRLGKYTFPMRFRASEYDAPCLHRLFLSSCSMP